jgi:hypothetical protein
MNIPADVVATQVPALTVIEGGLAQRASRAVHHTVASNPQAALLIAVGGAAVAGGIALGYLTWKFGPAIGRGLRGVPAAFGNGLRAVANVIDRAPATEATKSLREVIG